MQEAPAEYQHVGEAGEGGYQDDVHRAQLRRDVRQVRQHHRERDYVYGQVDERGYALSRAHEVTEGVVAGGKGGLIH